ncbi:uncharacterized protein SOCEGT47_083330 [Sorangium cellulosum]|uniref:Uncharacterized protein n=1 Tax=Sorangium cellulosum TaxID=56 RepID=A0A4P2QDA8_SORCE|nr:uncharacterized protein SOCEGT47_083330 [Sorangium cellulosum]
MTGRINGGVYRPINMGLYTYTWNNPLVLTDPTGQWPTAEEIEAGLARAGDTVLGFSYGFVLGATPVVGNMAGFLPPPRDTESFRLGMGAGQIAGGVVQMAAGGAIAGGSAAGGVAATVGSGGTAAPVAVPVAVAGVEAAGVLIASGSAAVMQGAVTMQMAATGGNKGGSSAAGGQLKWGNPKSVPTYGHSFERHGAGAKNTARLTGRAAGTKEPQGQWLDNDAAAAFLAEQRSSIAEVKVVEIPKGLGQVVRSDGAIVPATKAVLVPAPNGGYKPHIR